MDVKLPLDVAKLKALPRRLKVTLCVIVGGFLLIVAAYIIDAILSEDTVRVAQQRSQLTQLRQQSADLRRQVDQYPVLRARYDVMLKSGILAPPDAVGLVNGAQDLAGRLHLSDLRYKVEPQTFSTAGPNSKYQIGSTLVTFDSGALLDIDAISFWDGVLTTLPAHYQIVEASLQRIGDIDDAFLNGVRAGLPVSAVRVKLSFRWLALHPMDQEK